MNIFMQILFLIIFLRGTIGLKRYWMRNSNVLNKENWESENKNCRGMVFPKITDGSMLLDNMTISQIILPDDGVLYINNGATIIFDKHDSKCINIKSQETRQILDARNWNTLSNKAIPDTYRIPCAFDDIYIPENSSYNINTKRLLIVKSIQIGNKKILSNYGLPFIRSARCQVKEDMDCACRIYMDNVYYDELCSYISDFKNEENSCEHPLFINDYFCSGICGAHITFVTEKVPAKVLEYLKENSRYVDFYIAAGSRPKNQRNLFIVDKDTDDGFYSIDIAKNVYKMLKSEKVYKVVLHTSGNPIRSMQALQVTLGILLGGLFVTIIFFVAIFVVYVGIPKKYQYKITLPTSSKYSFRPFTFARFENKDEGGLSFNRSMASSVISLEKSFQNPMYGTEPSTSQHYLEVDDDTTESVDGAEMHVLDSPPLLIMEDIDEED